MITNILQAKPTKEETILRDAIAKGPTIIMFSKSYCPFCSYLRDHYHEVIKKFIGDDRLTFYEIDISDNDEPFKHHYGFKRVPKIVYFKDGQEAFRHGTQHKQIKADSMLEFIKKIYDVEPK